MATLFEALDLILLFIFGGFMLYLAGLSILAFFYKARTSFPSQLTRRFAVVVPAHNEEVSIKRTVENLMHLDYPKVRFDVVVVADNCTDATARIARECGATVLERTDAALRGKGYALRWCFDRLFASHAGYDAFVIIDADSVAEPDFLSVMNYYLEGGSLAIQCSDMVAPLPGSWSSEMTRFGFTLYNHVRPLARRVLDCSAGVRGNGMCFAASTLRRVPWNTYSLNEDLEYGLILLLNGINVDFAPEAKVLATMPASARTAESQRSRWEMGRFPVIRLYGMRLLVTGLRSFSLRHIDAFVELVTPAFVNLFGAVILLFFIHLILWIASVNVPGLLVVLWGIPVLLGFVHVFAGLLAAKADAALYGALLHIPRYALWKATLYAKSLRRPASKEWIRTERDRI